MDDVASILDEAAIVCARYVFSAHSSEYAIVQGQPGELAPVLASLREAVIKQHGEKTRTAIEHLAAAQMQKAQQAFDAAVDRQSHLPGDPIFENPFSTADPKHSTLAPYFQMMQEFLDFDDKYPDLSINWTAASCRWLA